MVACFQIGPLLWFCYLLPSLTTQNSLLFSPPFWQPMSLNGQEKLSQATRMMLKAKDLTAHLHERSITCRLALLLSPATCCPQPWLPSSSHHQEGLHTCPITLRQLIQLKTAPERGSRDLTAKGSQKTLFLPNYGPQNIYPRNSATGFSFSNTSHRMHPWRRVA